MAEQADGNERGVDMADNDRDHGSTAGTPSSDPSPFKARLLANLTLGLELQRAHRSRLTAA